MLAWPPRSARRVETWVSRRSDRVGRDSPTMEVQMLIMYTVEIGYPLLNRELTAVFLLSGFWIKSSHYEN